MTHSRETGTLELTVSDPMQLFNSMDPAPFRERDLDAEVAEYIIDWARERPAAVALALSVTLHAHPAEANAAGEVLRDAVHQNFQRRAVVSRRRLKRLFRDGRLSLVIGLAFLSAAIVISDFAGGLFSNENYAWLVQESVVIGGWVALWHPINIFLYDWWPIRAEARLYDRLAGMPVHLQVIENGGAPQ